MTARAWKLGAAVAGLALAIAACKTNQTASPSSAGEVSAGTAGAPATGTGTGGIPALVNVNLQNVLNDLSVAIKVDRANIPVNAQVPIDVAANVCGVSVSALSASIASGTASCTAKTTSPALDQAVQQQIAAGGSVGGGAQTLGGTTTNNMF
ncbi:MAG: hypothetical protein ACJ8FT_11485 [Sphingomonas sp.]